MRVATTLAALVVAAVCAVSAFADSAVKDPMSLVLRKADFPAGTMYEADAGDYALFKDRFDAGGVSFESATFPEPLVLEREGDPSRHRLRVRDAERRAGEEGLHDHEVAQSVLVGVDQALALPPVLRRSAARASRPCGGRGDLDRQPRRPQARDALGAEGTSRAPPGHLQGRVPRQFQHLCAQAACACRWRVEGGLAVHAAHTQRQTLVNPQGGVS